MDAEIHFRKISEVFLLIIAMIILIVSSNFMELNFNRIKIYNLRPHQSLLDWTFTPRTIPLKLPSILEPCFVITVIHPLNINMFKITPLLGLFIVLFCIFLIWALQRWDRSYCFAYARLSVSELAHELLCEPNSETLRAMLNLKF